MQLGISMTTLSKVMKLASLDDSITLSAAEDPTSLSLRFDSKNGMKNVNFVVNLLNIDGEHLGIPDTEYAATITMSSSEFSKNIHDLYSLAETVVIEASAGKITMSIEGDMGKGEVELIERRLEQALEVLVGRRLALELCLSQVWNLAHPHDGLLAFSKL